MWWLLLPSASIEGIGYWSWWLDKIWYGETRSIANKNQQTYYAKKSIWCFPSQRVVLIHWWKMINSYFYKFPFFINSVIVGMAWHGCTKKNQQYWTDNRFYAHYLWLCFHEYLTMKFVVVKYECREDSIHYWHLIDWCLGV